MRETQTERLIKEENFLVVEVRNVSHSMFSSQMSLWVASRV